MKDLMKEMPEIKKNESSSELCSNCMHFEHCGLRTAEPVYHCEYFEFKEKKENNY